VTVAVWVREPLVPVTVTLLVPVVAYAQLRVTKPEVVAAVRVTLAALSEQAVPPFWLRLTVPVKPFIEETVIVDVPARPTFSIRVVGLAVTE